MCILYEIALIYYVYTQSFVTANNLDLHHLIRQKDIDHFVRESYTALPSLAKKEDAAE